MPENDPLTQITLPDVYVTPDEKPQLTAGQGGSDEPGFADHFNYAVGGALDLRNMGSQIAPLDSLSATRLADHAGLPTANPLQFSPQDKIPPAQPVTLPQNLRQEYSDGLQDGSTSGAQDFAERVAGVSWGLAGSNAPADPDFQDHDTAAGAVTNAAQSIAAGLPDHEGLIDHSLALSAQVMGQPDLDMARVIRSNLLDAWAKTGASPDDMIRHAYAEPNVAVGLATPRLAPPPPLTDAELAVPKRDMLQDPLGNLMTDPTGLTAPIINLPQAERQHQAKLKQMSDEGALQSDITREKMEDPALKLAAGYLAGPLLGKAGGLVGSAEGRTVLTNMLRDESGQLKAPAEGATAQDHVATTAGAVFRSFFRQMDMDKSLDITADREKTAALLGSNEGERKFQMAMAQQALEPFYKETNKLVPDYQKWVEQHQANIRYNALEKDRWVKAGGDPAKFSVNDPTEGIGVHPLQALYDHIEDRPGGGRLDPKSPLMPLADTIRDLMEQRKAWLNADPDRQRAMREDYFPHNWTNPRGEVDAALPPVYGTGKEGSGMHLQERTVPTIYDGISRGLTQKFYNPIEGSLHYIGQVDSLMAAERNLRDMLGNGAYPGWAPKNPTDVKLDGRLAEKIVSYIGKDAVTGEPRAMSRVANVYAPEGMARIYNNWLSKGIHGWTYGGQYAGALFDNLMRIKNATLGFSLGLSGFHPSVILKQTVASQLGLAAEALSDGAIGDALKLAARAPLAPYQTVKAGMRMRDVYMQRADATDTEQQIVQAWKDSGGRAPTEGRGEPYWSSQAHNLFKDYRRVGGGLDGVTATLRSLAQPYKDAMGTAAQSPAYRAAAATVKIPLAMAETIGRISDTVMAPIFDWLVPNASRGAFYNAMERYITQNPLATHEAVVAQARAVSARVQNGMGEIDLQSLYWNKSITQAMQLATVSMGWEYGTWRAIGTSFQDMIAGNNAGKRVTTNSANLAGYVAAAALFGAVYQYAKTRTIASDPFMPQTRPNDPTSAALLPGEEKEITRLASLAAKAAAQKTPGDRALAYAQVLPQYLTGKVQALPKDLYAALTSGHMATLLRELAYQHQSIVGSTLSDQNSAATTSPFERWLGIHSAPRELTGAPKPSSNRSSRGKRALGY